jgi:hypothetical protein
MPRLTEDPLTPGLVRALSKQKVLRTCACGFPMPVYPGRYPSKCPLCATPRAEADDAEGTDS